MKLDRLTHRDELESLLRAYGVDYAALTGPSGPARKDAARFASRVLYELAESLWPEMPDAEGVRSWRAFVQENS